MFHPFKLLLLFRPAFSSNQSPSYAVYWNWCLSTIYPFSSIQRWLSPAAIKNPNLHHYPHNTLVRDNPTYSFTKRVLRCMADWFSHSHAGILWPYHISQALGQCTAHQSTQAHLLQALSKETGISQQWQSMSVTVSHGNPILPAKCGPFSQGARALFVVFLLQLFNATASTAKIAGNVVKSQKRHFYC